jgi:signal transduction histidine kinase
MERLLEDLLQYSRVGRHHQTPERVDTRALLEAVVEQLGIPQPFAVVVEGESLDMLTPRVPLEQVLRNLVDNAVKHHGGESGRVTVEHHPYGPMVRFSVRDDGAGIAPEYHERIFAMFQTLKPRDETEGSGMGLALVKKIVERHGGTLNVESAPGHGSEFSFTWPREWVEAKEDLGA